ncbi:MAG: HD domain-containing protein [Lachnospiraceae bacterium]|nr:HD domain-containing protein [Lachnospiraceae bacterium]
MKERSFSYRNELLCFLTIACGIAFNIVCAYLNGLVEISPLWLDSIGTITVAGIAGFFPGIITGVSTNILRYFEWTNNPYYAILSAAIAVVSAFFFGKKLQKKPVNVVWLILVLAFIGGIPGTWISRFLMGTGIDNPFVYELARMFHKKIGLGEALSDYMSFFFFDIIDKTISVLVALFIMSFVPDAIRGRIRNSGLRQEYVPADTRKPSFSNMRRSISAGSVILIVLVTIVSVGAVTWVSSMRFNIYARDQAVNDVKHAIELADSRTEDDELRECVSIGRSSPAYDGIEAELREIRDGAPDVLNLYIVYPDDDGFRVIFDLSRRDDMLYDFGETVPYGIAFEPYISDLLRGEEIEPVASDTKRGKLISVMKPFYMKSGLLICYIGGDVDYSDLNSSYNEFLIRVLLITAALIVVVIAWSIHLARNRLVLPINSMAYCANEFITDYNSRGVYDEARRISRLKISTGDEIENLYLAFRKMTVDTVAREQNIRKQSETISRMQSGLIVILADMVENRDNDTGNHIKRTAGYVKLIMEGLKKRGYYLDQLTDTFISDVIQSAPLHDLGKIGISDTILNKPGKLTPEEFETMKQHTVIGGDILDRAISEIHGESYLREARNLAHYHHEKWAGGGYPEGLSGEDIPLSARIMAIADVFDAVSQKRVYKEAFTFEQSVDIIRKDSGTAFDPKCVEAFMDSLDAIREVLESDGEEDMAV